MKSLRVNSSSFGLAILALFCTLSMAACFGAATFGTGGTLKSFRTSPSATLLPSGKVLLAGGTSGSPTSSAELYDPPSATSVFTSSMSTNRVNHTATMLPNGKVLVAGGSIGPAVLSSCELYNPVTGTWSLTGPMKTNRSSHTATLLPSGKVLVTGGTREVASELYDPATETWSFTGSMSGVRQSHSATLLSDGKVLIVGGVGVALSAPLATAEIFEPTNGAWSSITGTTFARR
jgi:hypothetical protein